MDAEGRGIQRLTELPSEQPDLSPDGTTIVFVATTNPGVPRVSMRAAAGGAETTVGQGEAPMFSPDGTRVAFARNSNRLSVYTLLDCQTQALIPDVELRSAPYWSGDRIYFEGTHLAVTGIFSVREDGQDLRTHVANTTAITNTDPIVTPGGGAIYFYRNGVVARMNTDGSFEPEVLTRWPQNVVITSFILPRAAR